MGDGIMGWVSGSLTLCLASLSLCIASQCSLTFLFFFFFFFLCFLLSPFGFGLLRAEVFFFFFFKIYMGHGLLSWPDDGLGVHDFWEGGPS